MKPRFYKVRKYGFLLSALAVGFATAHNVQAQTTSEFTYQGNLVNAGTNQTGNFDFQFTLYDALSAGTAVSTTVTLTNVGVSNGVFAVSLDFGNSAFDGNPRWIEIGVRAAGGGSYTTLTPRQRVAQTPYAMKAFAGVFEVDGGTGTVRHTSANYSTADFVFGAPSLTSNTVSTYSRFQFHKAKSAFRAGFENSLISDNWNDASIGTYSVAMGGQVKASGSGAVTFGYGASALGDGSYAHGRNGVYAQSENSFVVGSNGVYTTGLGSIIFGRSGVGTSGYETGTYSLTIGENGIGAKGSYSMVLGNQSVIANGNYSLAIGNWSNQTIGDYTFALGRSSNKAQGNYSLAIGTADNFAVGSNSLALGQSSNKSNGNYSIAVGSNDNYSNGNYTLAIGNMNNLASGSNSFAMGNGQNAASGANSFAFGNSNNVASGTNSFAVGNNQNTASGANSFAIGKSNNQASGTSSVAIGSGQNIASAANSVAIGSSYNEASGTNSYALGASQNIASGSNSYAIGSSYNVASAARSFVIGTDENLATGSGAMSFGGRGQRASGVDAIAIGNGGNTGDIETGIKQEASGNKSLAIGYGNFARSFAEVATGMYGTDYSPTSTSSSVSAGSVIATDRLFTIGNGTTATYRHNAVTILKDGTTTFAAPSISLLAPRSDYYPTSTQTQLRFMEASANGSNYVGFVAPANIVSNVVWTLPSADGNNGDQLTTDGSGNLSWAPASDRNKKENFAKLNPENILRKYAAFDLTTWNYKSESGKNIRHYGPMAQDFFAAFGHDGIGVIGNDTTIRALDIQGVNFTAIQALEKRTRELQEANTLLARDVAELKEMLLKQQVSLNESQQENAVMKSVLLKILKNEDKEFIKTVLNSQSK